MEIGKPVRILDLKKENSQARFIRSCHEDKLKKKEIELKLLSEHRKNKLTTKVNRSGFDFSKFVGL
jgi:hypothetical protein